MSIVGCSAVSHFICIVIPPVLQILDFTTSFEGFSQYSGTQIHSNAVDMYVIRQEQLHSFTLYKCEHITAINNVVSVQTLCIGNVL